jgi:hypothetical protein
MKHFLSVALIAISIKCMALEAGPYHVVGVVKSFNEQTIELDAGDVILEVPRNLVKQPLISGKKLSLILLQEQKDQLKIKSKKK